MTTQARPFSATDPPPADDIEASIEWSREIVKRNREFVERERRLNHERKQAMGHQLRCIPTWPQDQLYTLQSWP